MKPSPKEPETLAAAADQIEATINSVDVSDAERVELQMAANRFEKAALESSAAWKKDAMEKVEAEFQGLRDDIGNRKFASTKHPHYTKEEIVLINAALSYDIGLVDSRKQRVLAILTSTPTAESKASEK